MVVPSRRRPSTVSCTEATPEIEFTTSVKAGGVTSSAVTAAGRFVLFAFVGSLPVWISTRSRMPSPSVSGSSGFVM